MTAAEHHALACADCGAPIGADCTGEAAVCPARMRDAWAHRLSVSCATCQAMPGRACTSGTTCESRMHAAQPGAVAVDPRQTGFAW